MTPDPKDQDWRGIAELASKEMDPKKLAALVNQLCCAFDERDKRRREMCASARSLNPPSPADLALCRAPLPGPPALQAGIGSLSSL
jgi:hypothetical protein